RDLGNCKHEEDFAKHFAYLVPELYRIIMPGRLLSMHCMDLPATLTHDGFMGFKDFPGHLISIFEKAGFIYHSRVCIWKDPLVQATRTKQLQLAHKQISKDSAMCAMGLPDYIVTMRKPGSNPEPISHGRGFERYIGEMPEPTKPKRNEAKINKYSHEVWQRYASPVWFDIRQTHTLNSKIAKEEKDERHICPMQLDTIARCLELWTNLGDVVLDPFAGIGSTGYQALEMGRRFIGIELKKSYYDIAVKNLNISENKKVRLQNFFKK
ncbi:MAG: site-specific DNA-methyltransferase, partial [Bacteriovoracaceae bacterium]